MNKWPRWRDKKWYHCGARVIDKRMMQNDRMRSRLRATIVIAVITIGLQVIVTAAPLTVVENGEARATIVVAQDDSRAPSAAQALQKYIEKMSGATLDIIEEGAEPSQKIRIYVGHTQRAAEKGIDIPSGHDPSVRDDAFNEEGYILKTKGNDFFIGGNSDGPYLGVQYGAYALLKELGCRFYFPGDWGEVIPDQKTIVIPKMDITARPDFPMRRIGLNPGWVPVSREEEQDYAEWCTKVGLDIKEGKYPNVGDGFLGILLPPTDNFDAHPEWYAMDKKGKRHIELGGGTDPHNIGRHTMLCLSNPEVYDQILKNLKTAFAEKHYESGNNVHVISRNGLGISPPDGSPYCYCEDCDAASQKFVYDPYVYGPQMSEEYFDIAVRLADEFSDKYVATMAYSLRELPPQGVKLRKNMTVLYAPISACAVHNVTHKNCWRRQEFLTIMSQYLRQTPHVYLYDYNPNYLTGLFVPEPQTANKIANVPVYKKIGMKGYSAEGRKAFMQTWTSYYMLGKLLWDADADAEAIKQDIYMTFFGPDAGPYIQAWWDAVEAELHAATIHMHEDFLLNGVYTEAFTERIQSYIEAALKTDTTPAQRERVEAVALIAENLRGYAAMEAAAMHLDYEEAARQGQRMVEAQAKLHEIYSFFIEEQWPGRDKPPAFAPRARRDEYKRLFSMCNGEKGTKVADLPLEMGFIRDEFNEGVIGEWYAPDFDDSDWGTRNTHLTWEAQEEQISDRGHHYDGIGWYRGTFTVPKKFEGKPVWFHSGGGLNEVWVWINGEYVHHEPHKVWWWWNHKFDTDITDAVRPGEVNTIAIRVWNKAELGGLIHRGFFWSPTDEMISTMAAEQE